MGRRAHASLTWDVSRWSFHRVLSIQRALRCGFVVLRMKHPVLLMVKKQNRRFSSILCQLQSHPAVSSSTWLFWKRFLRQASLGNNGTCGTLWALWTCNNVVSNDGSVVVAFLWVCIVLCGSDATRCVPAANRRNGTRHNTSTLLPYVLTLLQSKSSAFQVFPYVK